MEIFKITGLIGFVTAAVAVSTAENATGEKFWMCVAVGCAGLALMGLSILCANIKISIGR